MENQNHARYRKPPSPKEIRRAAELIRQGWSEEKLARQSRPGEVVATNYISSQAGDIQYSACELPGEANNYS